MNEAQVYMILMIILMVLMILQSVALIIIVMLQKSAENNLGVLSGSSGSFFGRGKAQTFDQKLKRVTMGIAAGMLVCSILFFVFYLLRSRIG